MTSQPAIPPLAVIYQCPECETSYAGERRCPDCHLFCRKTGTGGLCPHCDEPVTLADLAEYTARITTPARENDKPPPAASEPHITLPATRASHLLFILGLIEDWLQDASDPARAELGDYLASTVTPVSSPGHLLYQIDAITRQLTS
ncbi:MAG: hypothetical protein ACRDNZ_16995 [Streptosporangiaceae bacterium]